METDTLYTADIMRTLPLSGRAADGARLMSGALLRTVDGIEEWMGTLQSQ